MQNVIKEAQYLHKLDHSCFISSYYSFFDTEKVKVKYQKQAHATVETRLVFCILMEFAENGDLYNLIEKHKQLNTLIKEEKIWNLARQMTDGLEYLHEK